MTNNGTFSLTYQRFMHSSLAQIPIMFYMKDCLILKSSAIWVIPPLKNYKCIVNEIAFGTNDIQMSIENL